ncbi:hypothetical protein SK128_021889 [Halocaridina rubra]|uniref:Uncharacterized protein n=1 Tax=Halocaridina rubra TaxID=373956 RepID=A0AAN8X630_HALRR
MKNPVAWVEDHVTGPDRDLSHGIAVPGLVLEEIIQFTKSLLPSLHLSLEIVFRKGKTSRMSVEGVFFLPHSEIS